MAVTKDLWNARRVLIQNCNLYDDDCTKCIFYDKYGCLVEVPTEWLYTDRQPIEKEDEHGREENADESRDQ